MLTNFTTIRNSLLRLKKLEKMEVDGTFESLTKKEIAQLMKEKARLERNLGGIKEMKELPGMIFIIDTRKEAIAVAEAQRVGVPIVAITDTNSNPENINFPIPGNDDAIRAITLFTQIIANAVIDAENEVGLEVIETLQDDEEEVAGGDELASEGREEEEEVVTAPVAARLGNEEEEEGDEQSRYTDQDYSDYDPSTESKEEKKAETGEAAVNEVLLEENVSDEDSLYEE
jgi:small subunit ribosomal protein S2